MCGINLIVDKYKNLDNTPIRQMNMATQHRGPDGSFYNILTLSASQVFLGHNRLKVIDLNDHSNQPFFSPDQQYILLFNGEIYNYKSLKAQLQPPYSFRTTSDTEVLLYWLIEKGIQGLKTLEGMFALVFIDLAKQTILLARDQFFIKPLYYYHDDRYLIVSSELKGLLASGLVHKQLNTAQITWYLTCKFAQPPQTFYQNIYNLQTPLQYHLRAKKINTLPAIKQVRQQAFVSDNESIEELLIQSVRAQLAADVPIGIFLSGGVDSTLLLSIAKALGIRHFPSFSITNASAEEAFGTRDYHFARLAAKQYESEHLEYTVQASDLGNISSWVKNMDQPIGDGAALLTFLLAQKSSQYIKVALSGAGADELFAGYNRHWAFYQYLKNYSLLTRSQRFTRFVSRQFTDGFAHPWRKKFRLIQKFFHQIDKNPVTTFNNFTRLYNIPINSPLPTAQATDDMPYKTSEDWLQWCLTHDQQNYLANDVLALTDAMSMQHGLEVRVPYLSQLLASRLASYPATALLAEGKKSLLKRWLRKRSGDSYTQRPKEGFGMPFGGWLQQRQLPQILEYIQQSKLPVYEWVNYDKFQKIISLHQHKKRDFSSEIWSVVVLSYWLDQHF